MQTLDICGFRISEKSNNKTKDGLNFIFPAINLDFEFTSIFSFASFGNTLIVTNNGNVYGIGDNRKGHISGSLPKKISKPFYEDRSQRQQKSFIYCQVFCMLQKLYSLSSFIDR